MLSKKLVDGEYCQSNLQHENDFQVKVVMPGRTEMFMMLVLRLLHPLNEDAFFFFLLIPFNLLLPYDFQKNFFLIWVTVFMLTAKLILNIDLFPCVCVFFGFVLLVFWGFFGCCFFLLMTFFSFCRIADKSLILIFNVI